MHRGSHYAKEMERANWDNVHVITLFCGLHFFHPPSPCFFFTVLFSRQSSFFSFPRLIRCFLSAQFRARVDIARFLIINIFHRDIYIVYLFYSSSLVWLFALNYYLRWTRFNGTRFDYGIRFFRFIYLFFFLLCLFNVDFIPATFPPWNSRRYLFIRRYFPSKY